MVAAPQRAVPGMNHSRAGRAPADMNRESASPRDLADLAHAGSIILRQPLMQATFEVHHVADRPGYLAQHVGAYPAEPAGSNSGDHHFGETLTTSANGLGLVVVIRSGVGVGSRRYKSGGQTQCQVEDGKNSRIFSGTARPNPSFIYESASTYEGLICVDREAVRARVWHTQALREIIHEVAKIARAEGSPILSLQSPAQVPARGFQVSGVTPDQEELILPSAGSIAVRFAIALRRSDAATTLAISKKLAKYCARQRFEFWVADKRLGSRSGNWFQICGEPDERVRSSRPRQAADRRHADRYLPVTLVGPARVGSSYALMDFLSQYRDVGVAACSITALEDLAFIHMQLAFEGVPESRLLALDKSLGQHESSAMSAKLPSEALISVLQALEIDTPTNPKRIVLLVDAAGDYQCLIGPSRPVVAEDMNKKMGIWVSWQTQGADVDVRVPLGGLLGALSDVRLIKQKQNDDAIAWNAESPNTEYLVCRNIGNSVIRGKGKLSVNRKTALRNYAYSGLESRPTDLCVSIEEAWRARSAREDEGGVGIRELTVAWRECWLGHWSLPL